ncbi:MAG TPA: hypothetical protein VIX12_08330 [Candidatus Binataceae bacterium]
MEPATTHLSHAEILDRLASIERAVEENTYRAGPWMEVVRAIRALPDAKRAAVADDLSRISRKLHLRKRRQTIPFVTGIFLELLATAAGGMLLAWSIRAGSNLLALAGAFIWMMTFQPLLKILTGASLGIRFDYDYLFGAEPRFKMKFGTYLAAPRWARIVFHVSGMIGSPLGVYLALTIVGNRFPAAAWIMIVAFWLAIAINLIALIGGLIGAHRLMFLKTSDGSGGAAGLELREAAGLRE